MQQSSWGFEGSVVCLQFDVFSGDPPKGLLKTAANIQALWRSKSHLTAWAAVEKVAAHWLRLLLQSESDWSNKAVCVCFPARGKSFSSGQCDVQNLREFQM